MESMSRKQFKNLDRLAEEGTQPGLSQENVTEENPIAQHEDEGNIESRGSSWRSTTRRSGSIERLPSIELARHRDSVSSDALYEAGKWALDHHRQSLLKAFPKFERLSNSTNGDGTASCDPETNEERVLMVSFVELQNMRLRKLQIKLAESMAKMHLTGKDDQGWETTLQQYVQAVRDYDYMDLCVTRKRDPFVVTSARQVDADVLRNILYPYQDTLKQWYGKLDWAEPEDKTSEPICGTRTVRYKKNSRKRILLHLGTAAIGGGFLIGPMWLMVLHNTPYTALALTSACVLVFGIVVALVAEDEKTVLSVTAAYVAVLVVFVGTNTATTT